MKIVIDIPECFYEYCKAQEDAIEIQLAVANGIPLPKGHGRLIDADALLKHERIDIYTDYGWESKISGLSVENAPTIIEADTEGSDSE